MPMACRFRPLKPRHSEGPAWKASILRGTVCNDAAVAIDEQMSRQAAFLDRPHRALRGPAGGVVHHNKPRDDAAANMRRFLEQNIVQTILPDLHRAFLR